MFSKTAWGAVAALVFAASANAGLVGMEWSSDDLSALDLAPDGEWTEGDDYTYNAQSVQMFETWVGGFGRDVRFDIGMSIDDRTPGTGIDFSKMLSNNTNFFWSSFQIVLSPDANSSIAGVTADPNSEFGDVNVSAGQNGSWIILWEQFNGTGVGIGEGTKLSFSFVVTGNLGFMMKQTPIPAPAGAALLGVAGLCGVRRRRA